MDPIEQARHCTLVIRCQLGQRPAMEELFLRHNRSLAYYLRRRLNRDDVADVQQEVWLTVIRRIGQLRSPEAFIVWLYQIARSKSAGRSEDGRAIQLLDEAEAVEEPGGNPEPEFSAADAEKIHQGLARLRDPHREVLVLRFMEDLSYEQIAEVIGCSVGTVRSRLFYAKIALREQLEKYHE
jgi:RNA polymerase sigma-70 factor (ECF subfamily)